MGRKRSSDKPAEALWLLTFCDCMTLLLCFFVLLMSFSSFEESKFESLAEGIRRGICTQWESLPARPPNESVVSPWNKKIRPQTGSPIRTEAPDREQNNRPPIEMLDLDVYKDRTVFYLPSNRFFWAQGISMTDSGKDYLHTLGELIQRLPCRIVIGETSATPRNLGLRRSWTVLRYFTETESMDLSRFTISGQTAPSQRFNGQGVLEITLMNVQVEG